MKNFKMLGKLFLAVLFVTAIACKGPQGPEGPQGPAGPEGPAGPQGPAGNANVISSNWIVPNWTHTTYYSKDAYKYEWTVNELTQSVYDNGVVLVYWKNSQNRVWPLPYYDNYWNFGAEFFYEVGKITIVTFNLDGSTASAWGSFNKFRYVLIPQGTSSRPASVESLREELAKHGVDIANYYDVCAYYGINP